MAISTAFDLTSALYPNSQVIFDALFDSFFQGVQPTADDLQLLAQASAQYHGKGSDARPALPSVSAFAADGRSRGGSEKCEKIEKADERRRKKQRPGTGGGAAGVVAGNACKCNGEAVPVQPLV